MHYRTKGCLNVELRSPPISSALRWVHQLSSRITTPIKSFQALQHPVVDTEEAQMLLLRYKNLIERLKRFEKEIFEKWAEKVPNQIEDVRYTCLRDRLSNNNTVIDSFIHFFLTILYLPLPT